MGSSVKAAWKRANLSDLPTADPGSGKPWLEGNLLHVGAAGSQMAATPVASPVEGSYGATQSVTLTSATSGAIIYYTIDGSTPTPSSTLYSGAISVASTTTIKAIATKVGYTNSAVMTAAYTITGFPSLGTWQFQYLAEQSLTPGGIGVSVLGDRVAQMTDIGGSNHALQSDATLRPTYIPVDTLTGKPAIRVIVSANLRGGLVAPNVSVNSRNFTFYAIIRPTLTANDTQGLFNFGSSTALSTPMFYFNANAGTTYLPLNGSANVSMYGNPMVITVVGTASAVNVYRNNVKTVYPAYDAATVTGGSLLYRGDSWPMKNCDVYRMGLIDSQLNDSQVAQIVSYATAEFGIVTSYANCFVMQGDSLTEGQTDSDLTGRSIPRLVADSLGATWKSANAGLAGTKITDMITSASYAVDRIATGVSGGQKVCVLFAGTNDLDLDAASAATTYGRIQTWCAARQATWDVIKVCTIVKRDSVGQAGDLNTRLADTNTLIRAGVGVDFDELIDLNALSEFSNTSNTTYYDPDKLHFTQAGRQVIANTIYATF